MRGDVRGLPKSAQDLIPGQFVCLLNRFDAFPGPNSAHDCGDIHSRASDAGLAEPDIWVHRDPRKHLHSYLLRGSRGRDSGAIIVAVGVPSCSRPGGEATIAIVVVCPLDTTVPIFDLSCGSSGG